ncbi:MAG: hypothetical protein AMXMBFR64_02800 [Myxococcales bacterium]
MISLHPKRFRMLAPAVLGMFLSATISATWPAVALAQQPRPDSRIRLYVLPLAKSPDVSRIIAVKIEEFFSAILSVSDKIKVLREDDLIIRSEGVSVTGPKTNPNLEQADKLVWQGKEEIDKKLFKEAVKTFQSAIELYQGNFAQLVDYDKLVDAHLNMAVAYFGAGYEDNGADALQQVVSLRPNVTVDRKTHSPAFVSALEKVQKKFSTYKPGTTTITATPAGAKVYIDGVLRGPAPVTVKDLQKGEHYVQVRQDGYETFAEQVRAPLGSDTVKVDAKLQPAAAAAADTQGVEGEFVNPEPLVPYAETGSFGDNFKRAAQRFTQKANVDFLLYQYLSSAADGYDLNLFLYDKSKGEIAALQPVKFDRELTNLQVNLLESEQALVRGMAAFPMSRVVKDPPPAVYREGQQKAIAAQAQQVAPTPVQPRDPVTPPPTVVPPVVTQPSNVRNILGDYPLAESGSPVSGPGIISGPSSDEQWYEKWWVWTLIGVGVAGAGVGAAAAAGAFSPSSSAGPTTFTGTVTVP